MSTNEYMNNYMQIRWQQRRQQAVEKLGGACVKCGCIDKLEFDHVDLKTKSFTIASGSSFSDKRFWLEIGKCQLLCYDCHKLKHSVKGSHGTLSSYRYCKCDLCREAKNKWTRDYKRNKRKKSNTPS